MGVRGVSLRIWGMHWASRRARANVWVSWESQVSRALAWSVVVAGWRRPCDAQALFRNASQPRSCQLELAGWASDGIAQDILPRIQDHGSGRPLLHITLLSTLGTVVEPALWEFC